MREVEDITLLLESYGVQMAIAVPEGWDLALSMPTAPWALRLSPVGRVVRLILRLRLSLRVEGEVPLGPYEDEDVFGGDPVDDNDLEEQEDDNDLEEQEESEEEPEDEEEEEESEQEEDAEEQVPWNDLPGPFFQRLFPNN